ncbi:FAD-dependent oxidoreductase [Pokkaliibacter sp. CJK22405]|uniref:FAD-dependent oxidoreductase n=1 Tax=Pokkaliibacter sp. CJK22405 TaxID=3384615 RepID=UPI00398511F5
MRSARPLLVLLFIILSVMLWRFDLVSYLDAQTILDKAESWQSLISDYPLRTGILFFLTYTLCVSFSLPGSWLLVIAAGAMFGLYWGIALTISAAATGAMFAAAMVRYIGRHWLESWFARPLGRVDDFISREGDVLLFALRMMPFIPSATVSWLFGLTAMPLWRFFWITLIGTLPPSLLLVKTGVSLQADYSLSPLPGTPAILFLTLIGWIPLLARLCLGWFMHLRHIRTWDQPENFDFNLAIIGAGTAGMAAADAAVAAGARVVVIDPLSSVPGMPQQMRALEGFKRAALRAAEIRSNIRQGLIPQESLNISRCLELARQTEMVMGEVPSVNRCQHLSGNVTLTTPWQMTVGEQSISTRALILATGALAHMPVIHGLAEADPVTPHELWQQPHLPASVLLLGGGATGCELAQALAMLGVQVVLVEQQSQLLPEEDLDVSARVSAQLLAQGVRVHTHVDIRFIQKNEQGIAAEMTTQDGRFLTLTALEQVIVACGFDGQVEGLGLEALGVHLDERNRIVTDSALHTRFSHILACGAVHASPDSLPLARQQGEMAARNALFGLFSRSRLEPKHWVSRIDVGPMVARAGLTEHQARARKLRFEVKWQTLEPDQGQVYQQALQVKLLLVAGKNQLLGAVVVGAGADQVIERYALMIVHGVALTALELQPGRHRRASQSQISEEEHGLTTLAQRFHLWRRGD